MCKFFLGRAQSCRWKWGILTRRLRSCRFYHWFLWVDRPINIISYYFILIFSNLPIPTYIYYHDSYNSPPFFSVGLCQNQSMNLMPKPHAFFLEKTPREGGCEAGDVGRKGNLSDPSLSSLPNGRTGGLVRLGGMLSSLGPVDIGHMVDIDSWYQWINQNQPW